jgi:uncharacterized membrane protein HdeD (DUF308 family)
METTILKNWWMPLLKGVIFIALSVLVFMHPGAALIGLSWYIGLAFLFSGIVITLSAISYRSQIKGWGWRLAEGLVDIFFGMILLFNPGLTALAMSFMMGFWFLFYGITSLTDSFGMKDEGASNWWVGLIWGILAIIFGFWIMFRPFAGAITIITLMGIFFLIAGLFNIGFAFVLKGMKKELEE